MAIEYGDTMYPKRRLSEEIRRIDPPDFSLEKFKNTPYAVLADLDLPIFMTTNYDHFLEAALESRNRVKKAQSEICRWSDKVSTYLIRAGIESIFKVSKYKPTRNKPLVFHLHGDINIPQSMVLTETDYNDFVIALNSESERGGYLQSSVLRSREVYYLSGMT